MIEIVLITSTLLASQVAPAPQTKKVEKAAPKIAREVDPAEALAKYNELREKTPPTAAAQWKLGLWCESHGLKAEAYVHFAEVARRDPKRDAAWRKLGFKKVGGHWTTDEQLAEDNEQKKADKIWWERLKKVHKDIHGTNGVKKRDEAQAVLDAIRDPRAIPSIYYAFGAGGPSHQTIAVQVLGQINKPLSTKVLAMLAVYGKSPDVQQRATRILRDRPPADFLGLLVGMMNDPIKYEVKPVGGPGSPGVLFVEGEKSNVSRVYAPPAAPNVAMQPGDRITFDPSGMPVIIRPVNQFEVSAYGTNGPIGAAKTRMMRTDAEITRYVEISPGQLRNEARRGALMAQSQLADDVAWIKSVNMNRMQINYLAMAVAKNTAGKDYGTTPKEWRDALAAGTNSPKPKEGRDALSAGTNPGNGPTQTPQKLTYSDLVPLAYNPVFAPIGFMLGASAHSYAFPCHELP